MVVTYQTAVAFPVKYIVFEFGGITSVHLSSDRSRPGGFESKIPHATHRVSFTFLEILIARLWNTAKSNQGDSVCFYPEKMTKELVSYS